MESEPQQWNNSPLTQMNNSSFGSMVISIQIQKCNPTLIPDVGDTPAICIVSLAKAEYVLAFQFAWRTHQLHSSVVY